MEDEWTKFGQSLVKVNDENERNELGLFIEERPSCHDGGFVTVKNFENRNHRAMMVLNVPRSYDLGRPSCHE
jgi:hypothetical protein